MKTERRLAEALMLLDGRALQRSIRVLLSVAILSTLAVSFRLPNDGMQHFTYLANAMVSGSFAVNDLPSYYSDKVVVDGTTYIPLAPMPAVLLEPISALFGLAFDARWLAYIFTAINLLVWIVVLKRLGIAGSLRQLLLVLFFCGTIYLSALAVGQSWFLSHIIATTFLSLAILEVLSRKRAWLIGAWLGMAFLTRSPTVFSLPFFLWMLRPRGQTRGFPRWIVPISLKMTTGFAFPLLFFGYYNYVRFGSPFETGYAYAVVGSPVLVDALKLGLFSVLHIPKNVYALLLAVPQSYPNLNAPALSFPYIAPSPWGMGIFFTTPAFVYAFAAVRRERLVRAGWLAIALVLLPLITYYGIGWAQFGYRYALDFYPFLFMLTALGIGGHFDRRAKVLITISIIINIWGAWWQMIGFRALGLVTK